MGKHYGKQILNDVMAMKKDGSTNREIGEKYGLTKTQIKDLLRRQKKNQYKIEIGAAIKKRGRPRKNPEVSENNRLAFSKEQERKKDIEIKRLKMENELLRDFLHLAGRK